MSTPIFERSAQGFIYIFYWAGGQTDFFSEGSALIDGVLLPPATLVLAGKAGGGVFDFPSPDGGHLDSGFFKSSLLFTASIFTGDVVRLVVGPEAELLPRSTSSASISAPQQQNRISWTTIIKEKKNS
jgi:hypothetical protein